MYYIKHRQAIPTNKMRGKKSFSKTPFKQGNSNKDRESTIRNSKHRMMTAHSVDINSQRKKVFQTSHSVIGIVLVLAICILHGGYLFEATQVGQNTLFFYDENGLVEARWSKS